MMLYVLTVAVVVMNIQFSVNSTIMLLTALRSLIISSIVTAPQVERKW